MTFLYWIFGVEQSLRQSLPSLSVHDEGLSRGWMFLLSLILLAGVLWLYRLESPRLKIWQSIVLAGLRWGFFLCLFFFLVRPVLVLAGEDAPGFPEIEKIDVATAPWILVTIFLMLCGEWWLRRCWRLK